MFELLNRWIAEPKEKLFTLCGVSFILGGGLVALVSALNIPGFPLKLNQDSRDPVAQIIAHRDSRGKIDQATGTTTFTTAEDKAIAREIELRLLNEARLTKLLLNKNEQQATVPTVEIWQDGQKTPTITYSTSLDSSNESSDTWAIGGKFDFPSSDQYLKYAATVDPKYIIRWATNGPATTSQSENTGGPPVKGRSPTTAVAQNLAQFPMPVPRPSAMASVPEKYLVRHPVETLGTVADTIKGALSSAGYSELQYLPTNGGFALVTRLERINEDGTPRVQERFSVNEDLSPHGVFTLTEYLKALFTAAPGYYRIIVFVVTNELVQQDLEKRPTPKDVTIWFASGTDTLPKLIRAVPFDAQQGFHCTALIYEFERDKIHLPSLLLPSPIQGADHLKGGGVWAQLEK